MLKLKAPHSLAALATLLALGLPVTCLQADPPVSGSASTSSDGTSVSGSGSSGGTTASGSVSVGSDGSVSSGSTSSSSGGPSASGSGSVDGTTISGSVSTSEDGVTGSVSGSNSPGSLSLSGSVSGGPGGISGSGAPLGDEPAPHGARPNTGFDGGTGEGSRAPRGSAGLSPHPAGQAADAYMEQRGVDPNSAAGQVVKPYVVGTTVVDGQWSTFPSYRYRYDARDNRTQIIDASGETTRYEYDSAGRLIRSVDPTGDTTTFRYEPNPQGMRVFATNPAGQTTRFQYDVAGRVTRVTDPAGNTSRFSYDADGKTASRVWLDSHGKPLGSVTFDPSTGMTQSLSLFQYSPSEQSQKAIDEGMEILYGGLIPLPSPDPIPEEAIDQAMETLYGGMRPLPSGSDTQPGGTDLPPTGGPIAPQGPVPGPQPGPSPLDEAIEQLQNPPSEEQLQDAINQGMETLYGGMRVLPSPGHAGGATLPGSISTESDGSVSGGSEAPPPAGGAGDAGGEGADEDSGAALQKELERLSDELEQVNQLIKKFLDLWEEGIEQEKAVDEGMEISYGGETPPPTPDDLRKAADALASKDPQAARFLRQQAEVMEAVGQQTTPQTAPGPTPEQAIDEEMEILYGGLIPLPTPATQAGGEGASEGSFTPGPDISFPPTRPLPPTAHEPAHLKQGQPGAGTIPIEILQMDLSGSSPHLGPVRVQTSGPTQNFTHKDAPGGAGADGGEGADEGGGAGADAGGTPGYVTGRQERELRDLANRPGATQEDIRNWAIAKAQLTGRDPNDIMREYYRDHAYENSRAVDADYARQIRDAERAGNTDRANELRDQRQQFRQQWDQTVKGSSASRNSAFQGVQGGVKANDGATGEGANEIFDGSTSRLIPHRQQSFTYDVDTIGETLEPMDFSPPPAPLSSDPVDFEPSLPPYVPPPAEGQGGAGDAGGEGADEGEGGGGAGSGRTVSEPDGRTTFHPPAPYDEPDHASNPEDLRIAGYADGHPEPSPFGGAGDAGGEGADEGEGETPPRRPVDRGGSLSSSNVIWIDEPGETPSAPGGAGDAGGEGAEEGGDGSGGGKGDQKAREPAGPPFKVPLEGLGLEGGPSPQDLEVEVMSGSRTDYPQGPHRMIPVEMIRMDLTGASPQLGPVRVKTSAPTQNFTHKDAPPGGAGADGGEGADEGGRVGSGGILVYSNDRDERIVGYADGHAADIDDFPVWFPKGPPGGAGADGGEGADEGEGQTPGDGTTTTPGGPELPLSAQDTELADIMEFVKAIDSNQPVFPEPVFPSGTGADGGEGADEDGAEPPPAGSESFSDQTSALSEWADLTRADTGFVRPRDWTWVETPTPTPGETTPPPGGAGDAGGEGEEEPPPGSALERAKEQTEYEEELKRKAEEAEKLRNKSSERNRERVLRDLGADQFLGSPLQFPLPPTGGEFASADGAGAGPTQLASLDPQLDTSGALLDGLLSSSGTGASSGTPAGGAAAGPDLTTLHTNFHADQAADLAAFQANQAQDPNLLNHLQQVQQFEAGHDAFHVVFPPGSPLIPAVQEQQIHDQVNQAQANLQATQNQQAVGLAAEQAQQNTDHTDFHTQNGIP